MTIHVHETVTSGGNPDPKGSKNDMRMSFGPQALDQAIGQAISICWMLLPDDRKSVANLDAEIRRIVDRALANLKEDAKAFGIEPPGK